MKIIESRIEINAPKDLVWQVLLDLDAYPLWNPFTPKVECSWKIGSDVVLHVDMKQNQKIQIQKETLLWLKEGESLAWGITSNFPVRTERAQILSALSDTKTNYYTYDKFWGLLVPLVIFLYGKNIQAGFDAIALGLKKRAEELYLNAH
ncbi:MAG: SRPBCC domain-containing protein [Chitinophagales bacterium]|nr:SRPBCC domain-containing protein [Bacteroidota bacterium]MCB9255552.1 SRPBCC domain-containing protein [Chitinophagales bacterium]